jgi:MYXO-CTERM domain-containing protein
VTAEATASSGATVGYPAVQATDSVSAASLTYSQASGSTFALGTTAVTVTATDAAGNATTCTFSVKVQDTTAPALNCPASLSAQATSAEGAAVTLTDATATDAVTASPTLTSTPASGSVFPVGTTNMVVSAKDDAGNTSTCTIPVTVTAQPTSEEPGCSCASTSTPGSGAAWGAFLMLGALVRLRRRRA